VATGGNAPPLCCASGGGLRAGLLLWVRSRRVRRTIAVSPLLTARLVSAPPRRTRHTVQLKRRPSFAVTHQLGIPPPRRAVSTLVVDVTYRCNSPCLYCQWGTPSLRKPDRPIEEVCVPARTIAALKVNKVVLSGGEPALNPSLARILEYYSGLVSERLVITNGLLMDHDMRARLLAAGATAFTFSIDSVNPKRFAANRGLPAKSLARIVENLQDASEGRSFGLGLNAVVTSATASDASVHELLTFAASLKLDFVRFSPVFDDGHVGSNAPHLRLGHADAARLESIAALVASYAPLPTNPPGFWRDLAALARGESLPGNACGLGDEMALLLPTRLVRCYWVASADIGPAARISPEHALRSTSALNAAKPTCAVDSRCFCLQSMDHEWVSRSTS
jgi:molybdenum cofactor biosynthesis enzyme MoaA